MDTIGWLKKSSAIMCWLKCQACLHSIKLPKSSWRRNRFLWDGVLSCWDVHIIIEDIRITDVFLNINMIIHLFRA